ncbi:sterol desaturase family protein [Tsukamurella soli]
MVAFVILMAVEWLSYRLDPDNRGRPRHGFSGRDTATSLSIFALGRITKPIMAAAAPLGFLALAAWITPLHLSSHEWWVWVAAFVMVDLCYYWAHRADHRIRLMWTAHSVHHSSEYFNLSTAVRLPWLTPASLIRPLWFAPAVLLGFPVWMVLLTQSLNLLYQFPIHTERVGRLPRPIEFVFNTPSHHRVHHGSNNPYLDKNYAGVFILWDRMFGSYAEELEPVRFGLTTNIETYNPLKANYIELAAMLRDVHRAHTWRGRIGYLLAPPGFHEDKDATSPADSGHNRILTS